VSCKCAIYTFWSCDVCTFPKAQWVRFWKQISKVGIFGQGHGRYFPTLRLFTAFFPLSLWFIQVLLLFVLFFLTRNSFCQNNYSYPKTSKRLFSFNFVHHPCPLICDPSWSSADTPGYDSTNLHVNALTCVSGGHARVLLHWPGVRWGSQASGRGYHHAVLHLLWGQGENTSFSLRQSVWTGEDSTKGEWAGCGWRRELSTLFLRTKDLHGVTQPAHQLRSRLPQLDYSYLLLALLCLCSLLPAFIIHTDCYSRSGRVPTVKLQRRCLLWYDRLDKVD